MATILYLEGFDSVPLDRLQKLGFACHSFLLSQISDIAHGTESLVYHAHSQTFFSALKKLNLGKALQNTFNRSFLATSNS